MKNIDVFNKDSEYIAHTYNRFPVAVSQGSGATATDFNGNNYIDFGSGIGTNSLGFCDERWVNAVTEQLKRVQHMSNLFYTSPDVILAERLCKETGYSKVFFGNSGAEANEGAIKIARKYALENKGAQCNRIITLENSFHGRTVTTLSATGQDLFHQSFTEGFVHVPVNDERKLRESINDSVCAVMIELVQGEGGVIALDRDYVQAVQRICRENNILLIVDEVQTGVGRTGTFLCCEQYGIAPNVITLTKGLGAGLPIGAVLMDKLTENVFQFGLHGSTFGGNPVVCAGAIEVLNQVCNKEFLAKINTKSRYLKEKLLTLPTVTGVTGLGLMFGISIYERLDARSIAERCVQNGLMILTAKKKLRILPPLNITFGEIDEGLLRLEKSLQ